MLITDNFERRIMSEIDSMGRNLQLRPQIWGGITGPNGGGGGPTVRPIGKIPQTLVTYDTTESAENSVPGSGLSLLYNLNRIRGGSAMGDSFLQQRHMSSGVSVLVIDDGITLASGISRITFIGATINPTSSKNVTITINDHIIEDEGILLTYRPYLNFTGAGVTSIDDSANNATKIIIRGGKEVLMASNVTPPDPLISSDGKDWIYSN